MDRNISQRPSNEGKTLNNWLYSLSLTGRSAWIGRTSILDFVPLSIRDTHNFRFGPSLHGSFDNVLIIEDQLQHFGETWPLILDESIRLLKSRGSLIIKFQQTHDINLVKLKRFLGCGLTFESKLLQQIPLGENNFLCKFHISRLNLEQYTNRTWSFGIVSNGQRKDLLTKIIHSIESLGMKDVQIMVAGPVQEDLNVEFHNLDTEDDLPRISDKKKLLVSNSRNTNICILHDRFSLPPDFLEAWGKFGYDFDVATMSQIDENGVHHPSIPWFPKIRSAQQSPIYSHNFVYSPGSYINGGVTIGKADFLKKVTFNHLLLHEEEEDVELSRQFKNNSVALRFNDFSDLKVLASRPNYLNDFILVSNAILSEENKKLKKIVVSMYLRFPSKLRNQVKDSKIVRKIYHAFLD
jgi:hypothetical protein